MVGSHVLEHGRFGASTVRVMQGWLAAGLRVGDVTFWA